MRRYWWRVEESKPSFDPVQQVWFEAHQWAGKGRWSRCQRSSQPRRRWGGSVHSSASSRTRRTLCGSNKTVGVGGGGGKTRLIGETDHDGENNRHHNGSTILFILARWCASFCAPTISLSGVDIVRWLLMNWEKLMSYNCDSVLVSSESPLLAWRFT